MNPNNELQPKPEEQKPELTTPSTAPVVSDVTPSTTSEASSLESTPVTSPDPEESKTPEPALLPAVTSEPAKKPSAKKYVAIIILLILLAAAAVAGVYLWQGKQLDDAQAENAKLTSQLTVAKAAGTATPASPTTSATGAANQSSATTTSMLPGQVDFDLTNARGQADTLYFETYVLPSTSLKEVWVEYGTSPDKLTTQTTHNTKELGLGDAGQYSLMPFTAKRSSLQASTPYFYRVAGKSTTGTTYSGVSAFTTPKQ